MLKSLFFRKKSDDELLPPPPPFPSMKLEEQEAVSEGQFDDLFNDVKKLDLEEETKAKPKKLSKKELKKLAKIKAKEAKLRKVKKSAPKEEFSDLGKDFEKDFDFEPGPEFQDFEEFNIGDLKAEEVNPKEIEEAEDEIESAIEGVKKQGKDSLFSGLFRKKAAEQAPMPDIEADDLDAINKMMNDARNALMNLDLEAAKNSYIDIMQAYNKLKPEDQAKIYHEIKDLYYERKNAEELKV